MKKLLTTSMLLLGLLLVVPRAEAGLFSNLLEKIGGAMEATNQAYWMGENSVGNTTLEALKGNKGNFFEAFDAVAGSVRSAQDQVLASLKEVWKAIKDIVLWLPRKLKGAFEGAVNRLAAMNQGGSVKERFGNLAGPAAPGESFPRASADSPAAPRASAQDLEAFGELMDMTGAIEDPEHRKEARRRIRKAYVLSLDEALLRRDVEGATLLLEAGGPLYRGNPGGMTKAMKIVARRHPDHAEALERYATRLANHARQAD